MFHPSSISLRPSFPARPWRHCRVPPSTSGGYWFNVDLEPDEGTKLVWRYWGDLGFWAFVCLLTLGAIEAKR